MCTKYIEQINEAINEIRPNYNLDLLKKDIPLAVILDIDSINYVSLIINIERLLGINFESTDVYNMNIMNSFVLNDKIVFK